MQKKGSGEKNEKNGFKTIFRLGQSSLYNDVGSEMITPLIPFYATALGGGGLAVGLISGLREGLSSLFKIFGGWFSDRIGKRMPFIFFGYLFSIISRFFLSVANSWQLIIAFISLERFGKLRDAPRDVLISQSTKKRGKGFGIHQAMDTIGGIIGTLLVILLFWKLQLEMKTIIFIAAGISAFSLIPLFFVKEKKTKKIKKSLLKGIKDLSPKLKYFILTASIFTLGNFGLYLFLLLRIKELTGSVVLPLIIYAVFNLVYALFVIPFGSLSDKIGRKKVLMLGYVLFFIVGLGLIYLESVFYVSVLFIIYGLVYAITQANHRAFVADMSGVAKGTALGLFGSIVGVVNIAGGLIAGLLWDVSYHVMFIYISVVAFISVFLLSFVKKK